MNALSIVSLVCTLALCGQAAAEDSSPDVTLSIETLDAIHARIVPQDQDQDFLAIPWRAALWPALEEARGLDRPVLLWAMNGHPLGCT
ncbi:MAG: hypothetical protein IPH13_22095 [Planctomycetes bacterium]|nr:hypothetical protein [Planctomycetota bacterium]MCC7169443.1 hypothetical protein [Planctomycetota bacterium]